MIALASELPREAVNAKLIAIIKAMAVGLGVFLSGFVIREPAPYELYMAGLIAVWALFGLRISRYIAPLLVLFSVFIVGGLISMSQLADLGDIPLYMAVSFFLALTAVFIGAVTETQPDLFPVIVRAWIIAAVLTSIIGILGYFNAFPGAEMFTLYGRAAGAFQDPNVFGPFLAMPGIYLLYRMVTDRPSRIVFYAVPFLVITAGIFLSFSRGAWGLFGFSAVLILTFVFIQTSSALLRLRIIIMGVVAIGLLFAALIVILQIPGVGELFLERAKLMQDYDSARLGRFARYSIGFAMAIERPFGIGPMEFGKMLGEDTHNIWLKALMDYSWLGFAAYLTLIVWTLAAGFRILFRDRPWQPYLLCAYVVLIGHIGLGTIIDTDHWRHFYLLLGMIWGCIALERRHQSRWAGSIGWWRQAAPAGRTQPP